MRLSSLLADMRGVRIFGDPHADVTAVIADSRRAIQGCLFVATGGARLDGTAFVEDAVARGARVVLSGTRIHVDPTVTLVVADSPDEALTAVASAFYGHPERSLRLAGVTGTDGKTSVAYLVAGMLSASGIPCGYLGTLGAHFAGEIRATHHTTPPPPDLHAALAWMRDEGAGAAVMEASSHSLDQGRLRGLRLAAGVFTTLGRDHLDYHHTPEAYLGAKLRLFDLLEEGAGAVVNADHPAILEALRARGIPMMTFSARGNKADLTVGYSRMDLEGTELEVRHGGIRRIIRSPLLGLFQVENLACAAATGLVLGLRLEDAADALGTVRHIPGRFQPVAVDGRVWAAVDYAHTPGALERALQSARTVARGRVVVVFGCGGDRDQGKRPLMGSIASRLADVAIVTSDNPRSEDPDAIIRQITAGADGSAALIVQSNRRAALALAAGLARYGDLVLVAGKGHETTQTIGDRIYPFSDAEELSALRPAGESTQGMR